MKAFTGNYISVAATSFARSVTDELTTLSETLRKDDEIPLHPHFSCFGV